MFVLYPDEMHPLAKRKCCSISGELINVKN